MQKDEVIYRQAAIDAIFNEPLYETGMKKRSAEEVVPAIFEKVKVLPSAQPESAQWVQMFINPNMYKCSNCQVAWNKRFVFDNDGYSENIFMKYCPCCGRKMQTKVDYE